MKKIGYVILTWNSEMVIKNCIESIAALTNISADIILVDNGSTDKTLEIINSVQVTIPHTLEIIKFDKNMGTTVSRNAAIQKLATHDIDYYCILDSDTIVNEDAMSKMIRYLDNNPDCGIVGPRMVTSNNVVQISGRCFPTVTEKFCKAVPLKCVQAIGEAKEELVPKNVVVGAYSVDYLMSACWMISKNVIDSVGLLDEKIFYAPEDVEYCIRVWKKGYEVVYYPEAQIIHEWQRLSKKKLFSKMNYEHIKGLAYMFKKHKYFFSARRMKNSFPQNDAQGESVI